MNKSDKKGFTLIEMITVIVILSLLVLIIVPLVSTNLKKGNEKAYQAQINNIIASAKNWGTNNKKLLPQDGNTISLILKHLQDEGYIDKNLKDPRTGETLNGCINIQNKNNKQHYTFNDNCKVVYRWSEDTLNIGDSIEAVEVTTNPSTIFNNHYLKHELNNNKITSSYVCFLTDKEYCIKGGDPSYYETNKILLQKQEQWFKKAGGSCSIENDQTICDTPGLDEADFHITADFDGNVMAGWGHPTTGGREERCTINANGSSVCAFFYY